MSRNVNVFVVHGHDDKARIQLCDMLKELGVNPIVLMEQPDRGQTIIEKFERFAKQSVFAFILLTPDDKQASDLEESEVFRARQNVIFEMGYFMSKLGRDRTRLIHRGKVELPSDVTGIIYLPYKNDIEELKDEIRLALFDGGLAKK